jgi:hypothetical protein
MHTHVLGWTLTLMLGFSGVMGTGVASAAEPMPRTVRGVVVATNLTDTPPTIVVRVPMPNKEELIVGADVPPETGITRGTRSVSLSDIKTGEVATVTYTKNQDGLVARAIHVR